MGSTNRVANRHGEIEGMMGRRFWVVVAVLFGLLLASGDVAARVLIEDETAAVDTGGDLVAIARWIDTEVVPIPQEAQVPLSVLRAQGQGGWSRFRDPYPPLPVWNPVGPKRVGLQAGHWLFNESVDELADLRFNPGTSGGGKAEWEVNLEIAQRAAAILRDAGVEVDVLPTTIPVRYRAHLFVSIHADGDSSGVLNGFKVTRPGWSGTTEVDDALVRALNDEYAAATGLPRQDAQVSLRMRWYYAFNARRYQHAVAPGVPQAIIETGFLTNWSDRGLLIGDPDRAARGVANGILKFLSQDLKPGGASTAAG